MAVSITDWATMPSTQTGKTSAIDTAEMQRARRNPWTGRSEGRLSPQFLGIRPVCSWCKIPVNRFTDYYNENTRQHLFRFECHGREETLPIDKKTVEVYPDYLKIYLSNYRPFGGDADEQIMTDQYGDTVAAAYIPRGAPVVRAPGGGVMPWAPSQPERPSPAVMEFMQKMLTDIANRSAIPPSFWADLGASDIKFTSSYEAERPVVQPRPQPKAEDFLLPARKPRIITLEN